MRDIEEGVRFSRRGLKQFAALNRTLGVRFVCAFVLRRELEAYIAGYEAQGIWLDSEHLELRYDHGLYVTMKRMNGVWYITDAFTAEESAGYLPIFFWQRIRRGVSYLLCKMLIGWRELKQPTVIGIGG